MTHARKLNRLTHYGGCAVIETLPRRAVLTVLTVTLVSTLCACAPEATAPQGGIAVARVVPVAVPDAWCTTSPDTGQDSTARAEDRGHPACYVPKQPAAGGGWLKLMADSTLAKPDTTK
jgi:hypothetical protein